MPWQTHQPKFNTESLMTLFQSQQSTKRDANHVQPDSNAVLDQETVNALTAAALANQFPQMRELLKQKQAKFGAGPQYSYWAGVLAAREGRFDDALALLEDAANRAPRIPAPRYELGNVLCALNRPSDAALAFESAILLNKSFVAAWLNLGKVRLSLGEITRAEHALTTAMSLDQGRVEIWLALAKLHEQAKFPDRAIALLQEMRRRFGADPARDAQLLHLLILAGKQHQTVELLEQMLAAQPYDPIAQYLLAVNSGKASLRADNAYITALFDNYAPQYNLHMQLTRYQAHKLIARALQAQIPAPASVLDLGCGTGLVAQELAAYTLTGVDLSGAMLSQARGYAALHNEEIGAFLTTSADSRYDAVVLAETLVHFGPLLETFKQIARVLSKNGVLCLNVETDPSLKLSQFVLNPTGRFEHSAAYLRHCCQQAGFEVLTLQPIESRLEADKPVPGLLLLARKASPAS